MTDNAAATRGKRLQASLQSLGLGKLLPKSHVRAHTGILWMWRHKVIDTTTTVKASDGRKEG